MSEDIKFKAELTDDYLVLYVPRNNPPEVSKTGKSLVVATTHGNHQYDVVVDGKPLTIGVNAYIKK